LTLEYTVSTSKKEKRDVGRLPLFLWGIVRYLSADTAKGGTASRCWNRGL